jgi:two-component system, chemotaxis family, protein-glutamate methylesterase/glutaminase
MSQFRILVVDDSMFMRRIISDAISEDPAFQVIGTAKNGKEAVALTKQLSPDAVTMDLEMPELNGLEALQQIMAECPTPVVMLSSLTEEGAKETIRALELGAIDFVRKPSGSISLDLYKVKQLLHEKLHIAVKARMKQGPVRQGLPNRKEVRAPWSVIQAVPPVVDKSAPTGPVRQIVAIGTSTGGPRALQQVLTGLPAGFPAAIVIVQHMPPGFTKSLAQRLDSLSRVRVLEAVDGQLLEAGTALIAPGGWHMKVTREAGVYRARLNKEPPKSGHRPSVDVLYDSLLSFNDVQRHVVLLTGMGSDGAKGMLKLRKAGAASTIAEAEETCVVYGMPRSAVELQGAEQVVPLHDIAGKLVKAVQMT